MEIETGFIDLVLARPVARHWIVTRSILAALISTPSILLAMMALGTWDWVWRQLCREGMAGAGHPFGLVGFARDQFGIPDALLGRRIAMAIGLPACRRRGFFPLGCHRGGCWRSTGLPSPELRSGRAWKPAKSVRLAFALLGINTAF